MEEKNLKTTMLQLLEEFEATVLLKDKDKLEGVQTQLSEKFFGRYENFIITHDEKETVEMRNQLIELYKKLK